VYIHSIPLFGAGIDLLVKKGFFHLLRRGHYEIIRDLGFKTSKQGLEKGQHEQQHICIERT
jgi:hypothetical protein